MRDKLKVFFSKKSFVPPADFSYRFYRRLSSKLYTYYGYLVTFCQKGYEDFLCDYKPNHPVQYSPNLRFRAAKVTSEPECEPDNYTWEVFDRIDIEICVEGNEIKCYLLINPWEFSTEFCERLSYQMNMDVEEDHAYYICTPKVQEYFVLDLAENLIVFNENKSTYDICDKGIENIVKKLVNIGERIIRFAEKEGFNFDED